MNIIKLYKNQIQYYLEHGALLKLARHLAYNDVKRIKGW